jgi:hypothetical protein
MLLGSLVASGCNFQNSSNPIVPTGPSNTGGTGSGGTGSTGGGNGGNTGSSNDAISKFSGVWASSSIAGLPLGQCSDVKWTITTQTATTLAGNITATCDGGVTVAAALSGTLRNANVMDITATGSFTAMGVPCAFNLSGTGTRQSDDTMKVDYTGTYCFGNVSGTETLRKFPL